MQLPCRLPISCFSFVPSHSPSSLVSSSYRPGSHQSEPSSPFLRLYRRLGASITTLNFALMLPLQLLGAIAGLVTATNAFKTFDGAARDSAQQGVIPGRFVVEVASSSLLKRDEADTVSGRRCMD